MVALLAKHFFLFMLACCSARAIRHPSPGEVAGAFFGASSPPTASTFLLLERAPAKSKMLRARIRPAGGADRWRRFFGSIGSGGDKGGGEIDLSRPENRNLARRRALTLSLWRDYLCLLGRLSPEDAAKRKAAAAAEVRNWKAAESSRGKGRDDNDDGAPLDPDAGVKRLVAAVSFLRATTPRGAGERKRLSSSVDGVFVVRKGELVRVEGGGGEQGASSSR